MTKTDIEALRGCVASIAKSQSCSLARFWCTVCPSGGWQLWRLAAVAAGVAWPSGAGRGDLAAPGLGPSAVD